MATAVPALHPRLREYASVHATAGNRACHWVGIPMIVTAVLGLLGRLEIASLGGVTWTAAEVAVAFCIVYYSRIDVRLAVLMVPAIVPFDALGRVLPAAADVALFVVGWIFQLVGHAVYEKKSPAFFENVVHLLIGPLYLLAKAAGRA
jgi:uncharacterized membrane protein YGL010W